MNLKNIHNNLVNAGVSQYIDLLKSKKYYGNPHRHFHTWQHIEFMLDQLYDEEFKNSCLIAAILFHDIIYNPKNKTNEEDSCQEFLKIIEKENRGLSISSRFNKEEQDYICKLIMSTKDHKTFDEVSRRLIKLDMSILTQSEFFEQLLNYEDQIFKEYQFCNIKAYREERIKFLNDFLCTNNLGLNQYSMIESLIEYISIKKYKVGIYPGSFNPFHIGHYDILQKAERIFDKVILVQAVNPDKGGIDTELPESISNRQIVYHKGLITEVFESLENVEYTLIRGLRNEYDLAQEENYRKWIQEISKVPIEFCYFFCDSKYEHISSSQIKNLMKFDNDKELVRKYILE